MDVSAEAADLVVKEGIQATESAVKLAGSALKNVAALLLALMANSSPSAFSLPGAAKMPFSFSFHSAMPVTPSLV